jgi:hypothetical protein
MLAAVQQGVYGATQVTTVAVFLDSLKIMMKVLFTFLSEARCGLLLGGRSDAPFGPRFKAFRLGC